MNERIKELMEQAEDPEHGFIIPEKFAELIVRECIENFTKVWYEQGLDIRGAELEKFLKRFKEHFGVEE